MGRQAHEAIKVEQIGDPRALIDIPVHSAADDWPMMDGERFNDSRPDTVGSAGL